MKTLKFRVLYESNLHSEIYNLKSPARNLSADGEVILGKVLPGDTSMTPAAFRKLALSHPESEQRQHMDHPDFRVAGKIFATLGYPDKTRGMVKLSPEGQHNFSKDWPDAFVPVKGTWGKRGATSVYLKAAKKDLLAEAIEAAWCYNAPKRLLKSK